MDPSPASAAAADGLIASADELARLRGQVARLQEELQHLRSQTGGLANSSSKAAAQQHGDCDGPAPIRSRAAHADALDADGACPRVQQASTSSHGLNKDQVQRYSRHLLLPAFGVEAQARLCAGSVLIIGCGGLGSPAALYLAAGGVGRIGLVDHDTVDVTNLHRQIIHTAERVGMHKAQSAQQSCHALNPTIRVDTYLQGLRPSNALEVLAPYDVVIDASDNPPTRYLISDACVVLGKPLVSAAAVGTDGQLTVYHHGEDGPCYRCLFPESPAPQNCSRCGEAGVLGVVPGIMGCLQALEATKVLAGVGDVLSKKLMLFDALAGRFTTVKLRAKRPGCVACGEQPLLTTASLPAYDYVAFTGQPPDDGPPVPLVLLAREQRLSAGELAARLDRISMTGQAAEAGQGAAQGSSSSGSGGSTGAAACAEPAAPASTSGDVGAQGPLVLLDVRPEAQFRVMSLPGAVHVPFEQFSQHLPRVLALCGLGQGQQGQAQGAQQGESSSGSGQEQGVGEGSRAPAASSSSQEQLGAASDQAQSEPPPAGPSTAADSTTQSGLAAQHRPEVVVLCRRGNNSQLIVQQLQQLGVSWARDLIGGYTAWAAEVDPDMPVL